MAGNATKCAQFRKRMLDAASEVLSGTLRAGFEAHLHECAACREEFQRVQTLMHAIDERISASVTAEPSLQFMANVRQQIAAQPSRTSIFWSRNVWLTAACACAAFALLFFASRWLHTPPQPLRADASRPIASPPAQIAPLRAPHATQSGASTPSRPRALTAAHHALPRVLDHPAPELQVIVEPGQMQAIFELVAATQTREVNGANLLDSQKKAGEPFEIKPLTITPLKISALKDDSEPLASISSQDGTKDFLSRRSN